MAVCRTPPERTWKHQRLRSVRSRIDEVPSVRKTLSLFYFLSLWSLEILRHYFFSLFFFHPFATNKRTSRNTRDFAPKRITICTNRFNPKRHWSGHTVLNRELFTSVVAIPIRHRCPHSRWSLIVSLISISQRNSVDTRGCFHRSRDRFISDSAIVASGWID